MDTSVAEMGSAGKGRVVDGKMERARSAVSGDSFSEICGPAQGRRETAAS